MKKVFLSYSHKDLPILENFKRHISSIANQFEFWDDNNILAGQNWKKEIESALLSADFAVLFISADFFNSMFIQNYELPALLQKAQNEGTVIISVILKPCMFSEYHDINKYQAINDPAKSLIQMSEAEQEETWVKLLKSLKKY